MTRRYGVSLLATVIAGLLPLAAAGQPAEGSGPRTPWGDPDLQGVWTSATYTPLERPETLGARAFLTEEEAAQLAALVAEDGVDPLRARGVLAAETDEERQAVTRQTQENIHYDNAVWLTEEQRKTFSTRRTSLIVDPPDGRIPPRVPEAVEREAKRRQASRHLVYNIDQPSYEGYHTRTLQERCLVWRHEGPPMVPPSYNDMLQIFQTPDHVVVMQEMSNNPPRIIPLDQPHLPSRIRQWPGDSRGRWEGDTLVVDTVNFNEKTHYEGSTEALRVVERFTRVDRRDDPLRVHGAGRPDLGAAVERGVPADEARGAPLRVRLPRGEPRHPAHPRGGEERRAADRGGAGRATRALTGRTGPWTARCPSRGDPSSASWARAATRTRNGRGASARGLPAPAITC